MREFGTKNFYYPKSTNWTSFISLIRYAGRSSNVNWYQAIDNTNFLPKLGDVELDILWPEHDGIDQNNENNNSVVLQLTLSGKSSNRPVMRKTVSGPRLRTSYQPIHIILKYRTMDL
jgi:beta-lactamase superfamily II metal-dependent hydrolase